MIIWSENWHQTQICGQHAWLVFGELSRILILCCCLSSHFYLINCAFSLYIILLIKKPFISYCVPHFSNASIDCFFFLWLVLCISGDEHYAAKITHFYHNNFSIYINGYIYLIKLLKCNIWMSEITLKINSHDYIEKLPRFWFYIHMQLYFNIIYSSYWLHT